MQKVTTEQAIKNQKQLDNIEKQLVLFKASMLEKETSFENR